MLNNNSNFSFTYEQLSMSLKAVIVRGSRQAHDTLAPSYQEQSLNTLGPPQREQHISRQ